MKNSLNKLSLWQIKRNELPIKDEPQNDWLAMQSMLDMHLPVIPVVIAKKVTASSKALKVVKALKAIKSSSLLFISVTAAACASLVIYSVHLKHQQHTKIQHKKHRSINHKDSLSNTLIIDSLNLTDSIDIKRDSLSALKQPTTNSDTDIVIPNHNLPAVKNNINNKNIVATTNNAGQTTAGNSNKSHQALAVYNSRKATQNAVVVNSQAKNSIPLLLQGINTASQSSIIPVPGTSQSNTGIGPSSNGKEGKSLINGIDSVQKDHDKYSVQPPSKSSLSPGITAGQNTVRINKNTAKTSKQVAARFKGSQKIRKEKSASSSVDLPPPDLEWGILAGVNSSGSFTPKNQNANIYGKLPVDIYLGLFATYHFNDKWAINSQIRVLNPQNLNSSFSHFVNENKADSGKVLAVTDSRKAYFVSIPIHLVYKINNNISLKGGPVINIPVKQITNSTSLQPGLKLDSAYNIQVSSQLKAIKYDQKINLGLSGGVSLQYKRIILEATYLKSFSGYNVISDFGNYKSNKGTLQVTLGLQLNRIKL